MEQETRLVIGRTYPNGNRNGERGERVLVPVDPNVQYTIVCAGIRTPMEFDTKTGTSREVKVPQF